MKPLLFFLVYLFFPWFLVGQKTIEPVDYLKINATANDPLYTTYAAAMQRSILYGDKAYKMDYYSDCSPLSYSSDHAGKIYSIWKIDQVVVNRIGEYFSKPVVHYSFPDMMKMEYEPFRGIHVEETFLVYSSSIVIVDMIVRNTDIIPHDISVYPVLELGNDSLKIIRYDDEHDGYITNRYESPYRLISSLKTEYGYPTQTADFFSAGQKVYSHGGYPGDMNDFYNVIKTDFYSIKRADTLNHKNSGYVNFVSLLLKSKLTPGEETSFRYIRGAQAQAEDMDSLMIAINNLKKISLQTYFEDNVKLFSTIPMISFDSESRKLIYLGAFNLVRGCMYPPSGKTSYNFYAFSRNPVWGWGHGHQVLHESLSMLSYAYLDPSSAEGSQRVYMEQQGSDGFIAYRHGPRGMQDYPHKNIPTTSAPFFNWINWEVYNVSHDRQFLREAYVSGTKYAGWLLKNRDMNHDGTFEWGPNGIIENVRDWYNAVFQVSAERYLDVDKEDISDELECLDLTCMVIKEERTLSKMALELGLSDESKRWKAKADSASNLLNKRMWDETTGFYYSVNKKDYSFQYMTRDLKRQEIIGFLPLWAEAAPTDRADKLVKTLIDPSKFWRKYGVPTLSAQDPWYSPYVDYCCKWNGPVWLLWDYMVYEGLRNYRYDNIAKALSDNLILCVCTQLSKNHNFWESYSPDNEVLNCPSNYIWDSIMAKLLIEESQNNHTDSGEGSIEY
ncbi:MAG: trehalase family glycosidase [Bacteroidetes bacterium]|nr:trehalase family glycosidase [Bacteroidota bacterium]